MYKFITKRILHAMFIMWLVATTVFFGVRFIPGGPVRVMLGRRATPAAIEALRQKLGLDRPLYVQYLDWLTDLLVLDLGRSFTSGQKIIELIATSAPKTFSIAIVGIIVGLGIAIPTGIISATHKQEPVDYVATASAFFGVSMPAFFIGILLALIFGVWFNVLPVFGYTPLSEGFIPWFTKILLPGIAVGLPYAAIIMRMMRSSLLEVQGQQYMQTARAKGVGNRVRLFKHALQNALIPVVTVAGIQLALILVGSVTVELVFAIKGLGRLLVNAVLTQDYPVIQAVILLIAAIMIFINLLVDIIYTMIDPRIRYEGDSV